MGRAISGLEGRVWDVGEMEMEGEGVYIVFCGFGLVCQGGGAPRGDFGRLCCSLDFCIHGRFFVRNVSYDTFILSLETLLGVKNFLSP